MSTRAIYTFKDDREEHHVYKHYDGYPSGAIEFIIKALDLSWELPRFEADEFAASFIAANKDEAGDLRLTSGPDAHGDLSFKYETTVKDKKLYTRIFEKTYPSREYNLIEEGYTGQLWSKYSNE
jgi:hypothetical protein